MLWIITCLSAPDTAERRAALLPEHGAYLDTCKEALFFGGGLQTDDAAGSQGAVFILKVDSRAEAEAFIAAEPLNKAGIFASVVIRRLVKGRFHPELVA